MNWLIYWSDELLWMRVEGGSLLQITNMMNCRLRAVFVLETIRTNGRIEFWRMGEKLVNLKTWYGKSSHLSFQKNLALFR